MAETTLSAAAANPAAAFYGGNRVARWLGGALRLTHRIAPAAGTRLALRLFFTPLPLKTSARQRPVPEAWRAQRHRLERGSFVLWTRRDADAPDSERPKVLLVHGWAGDAMQMRELADALAEAGFAPMLLDFPAHGRSDGWRSTLPQFVRTLFAVQARIGPLHAVIAHSLGALAITHAAAKGLAVERMVLIAPSAPPAKVIHWFAHGFGVGEPLAERMKQWIEGIEGIPLDQFEPAWLGQRTTQPTLIVHDRADRAAPFATGEGLTRALKNAQLLATDGLGHRRVLTDASVIRAVTRHL